MSLKLFDVLYLHNQMITLSPLSERKRLLMQSFGGLEAAGIEVIPFTESVSSLEDRIRQSLEHGCEGLVLKQRDSVYSCGQRTSAVSMALLCRGLGETESGLSGQFRRLCRCGDYRRKRWKRSAQRELWVVSVRGSVVGKGRSASSDLFCWKRIQCEGSAFPLGRDQ